MANRAVKTAGWAPAPAIDRAALGQDHARWRRCGSRGCACRRPGRPSCGGARARPCRSRRVARRRLRHRAPGDSPLSAAPLVLPRGRRLLADWLLADWAPDVLEALLDAGADPQDLALKLHGSPQPGDEDLVYLWVRRPVVEWALRRAAAAEPAVEIRAGVQVTGLLTSETETPRAVGVAVDDGDPVRGDVVRGDVVVDALGRYRCPPGWPRAAGEPTGSGAIYYCRYFELADGVEHLDAPILNPRGDLGYMGFTRSAVTTARSP
jgi:hypothetical protein